VRDDALKRWPRIQIAITALADKVRVEDVRMMNEAVDGQHRDPGEVVRAFRVQKKL
jgi:osmoprotectant transport system substrate-binding protein